MLVLYFYKVAWNLLTYTVDVMYSYDNSLQQFFKKINLFFFPFGGIKFALPNSDRNKTDLLWMLL